MFMLLYSTPCADLTERRIPDMPASQKRTRILYLAPAFLCTQQKRSAIWPPLQEDPGPPLIPVDPPDPPSPLGLDLPGEKLAK
jgi:hypothetical protein